MFLSETISSIRSLVEIGSVVSEEKIFFKFHPPFFLFLAWRPFRLEVEITGHNFGRGPCKDYSTKVWLQLAQWFLRRRLLCDFRTLWAIPIKIFLSETICSIRTKFWWNSHWMVLFQKWVQRFGEHFFLISSTLFSISSLTALLVESRDHRTQLWNGAMQRPFHQSLVGINLVVSSRT
jgi:hypothetical protein